MPQDVGAHVALGRGGFADDTAPADALVALLDVDGEWVVGESLAEARRLSGKIQGRRTTAPAAIADRVAARRLDAHAADDLGRAGVPRTGRRVVRAGWHAGQLARQRRRVRRQGRRPRSALSPGASPTGTDGRCGSCSPAKTSCGVDRSVPRSRRVCAPTARASSGSRGPPGIAAAIAIDRARPGGRRGRRGRTADHPRRSRGGLGRGSGVARLDLRPRDRAPESTPSPPRTARPPRSRSIPTVRCTCASDAVIRSTRWCCAATAPAPPTWRSAGYAARASRSPTTGHRSTSRSARSGSCAPSTPHRSTSRSSPTMDAPVNGSDAVFAAVAAAAWRHAGFPPRVAGNAMNRDPVPSAR